MFWRGRTQKTTNVFRLIQEHFSPAPITELTILERKFPLRIRADLQRALDRCLSDGVSVLHFGGVLKANSHFGIDLPELLVQNDGDPAVDVPPQYEEVDIGDGEKVRCVKGGLWLLESEGQRIVLFIWASSMFSQQEELQLQVACLKDEASTKIVERFFAGIEAAVASSTCYREKILSLEKHERYSGTSSGITVHKLRLVEREQVILPQRTLNLLERNVIQFVKQRPRLRQMRMSTKKGLLFYGPPGTGKTHTIHFLARGLPGHTTLLISAEQVGLLSEYMTLARLLQPSIVVLEDVDLIARDRSTMDSPCEEVLLNKLLNEMDGLKDDADILFILTTNRPEALEAALASRPGRIDQAIEFPLPDEEGRRKLVDLYSGDLNLSETVVDEVVRRTDGVSASFIKELMRRTAQFVLERDGDEASRQDIDEALDEMLFKGGSLNLKILGAAERVGGEA